MKIKKDRRKMICVTLPENLIAKIEEIEEKQLINKSRLVENLIKKFLEEKNIKKT